MRKMILLAFAALAAVACTRSLDEAAVIGGDEIRFVVGDFPAFGDPGTRVVGTEDSGKTGWAAGDELLVVLDNNSYGTQYATVTYNGNGWGLTKGKLVYKEGDAAYVPHVYYAHGYTWGSDGKLELKEGKVAGMDECIEGYGRITNDGQEITVSFSNAKRDYSRLRIATLPEVEVSVAVSVQYFTPAGSTSNVSTTYTLHSDVKGNAYLYGSFDNNATVSVKYGNAVLASYTFGKASEGGKSYVLDATVVSMEGMSLEEIDAVVSNIASEVDAGKTRFNIRLAAEPGSDVFDSIKGGLAEAGYARIDLTLMGCKTIPSKAFSSWKMLKSVTLPDVTEIGESAFAGCSWLEKVVFGSPLTKVYGNPSEPSGGGVFEGVETSVYTDLVLSGEQNQMSFSQVELEDVRTADDGQLYKGSSGHMYRKFLGYTFKSVTCGGETH